MQATATIEQTPDVAAFVSAHAHAKFGPPGELIISPFPGLVHVVDAQDITPFHWSSAVPFVIAIGCVMALLAFFPLVV